MDKDAPRSSTSDTRGNQKDVPPYFPECEVFEEGGLDAKQRFDLCQKNPCHTHFIPVNKFTMDHLPLEQRTEKVMETFRNCCDRTVKINVRYTSLNRPDTYPNTTAGYPYADVKGSDRVLRCGTGVIYYVRPSKTKGKMCPCHVCKTSGAPKNEFGKVEVFTATHVVFDDSEAERTVCDVFYDSEDRSGVKYLYGVKGVKNGSGGDSPDQTDDGAAVVEDRCSSDKFFIQCVTHDMELFELLQSKMGGIYSLYYGLYPFKFIISHPHGFSKHIAFGQYCNYTLLTTVDYPKRHGFLILAGTECKVFRKAPPSYLWENRAYCDYGDDDDGFDEIALAQYKTDSFALCTLKQNLRVKVIHGFVEGCKIEVKDGDIDWITFPEYSKFTTDGRNGRSFELPNFKFHTSKLVNIFDGKYLSFFMTYNIPTCNGSSGAQVVSDNVHLYGLDWATHFGSLPNGTNRSGINKHFLPTFKQYKE